jgi:hypothetical protein
MRPQTRFVGTLNTMGKGQNKTNLDRGDNGAGSKGFLNTKATNELAGPLKSVKVEAGFKVNSKRMSVCGTCTPLVHCLAGVLHIQCSQHGATIPCNKTLFSSNAHQHDCCYKQDVSMEI